MGTLVKLAGVGCLGLMGLAVFGGGSRNTGGAVGPPVLADIDMPSLPRPASRPKLRAATFSADAYGQFWIDGTANGIAFRFLADTGASEIVFSKRDARRLGLDVNRLRWDGRASTANGTVRTASARIARLSIGPFTVSDVPISVNDGDLDFPLLGMAFLRRLNLSIGNGTLTLSGEP